MTVPLIDAKDPTSIPLWASILAGAAGGLIAHLALRMLLGIWGRVTKMLVRIPRVLRPLTYDPPRVRLRRKGIEWVLHLPKEGQQDKWDAGGYTLKVPLKVKNKDRGAVTIHRSSTWVTIWDYHDSRQIMRLSGDPAWLRDLHGDVVVPDIVVGARETMEFEVTFDSGPFFGEQETVFLPENLRSKKRIEGRVDIFMELSPRPGRIPDELQRHRTCSLGFRLRPQDLVVQTGTWSTARAEMLRQAEVEWRSPNHRGRMLSPENDSDEPPSSSR